MIGVVATQLTTPDTTRAYTVNIGPGLDVSSDVFYGSMVLEDQGSSAQGSTSLELRNVSQANVPQVADQALVAVYDHVSGSQAFRGFIDSRNVRREPLYSAIALICSDQTSLLDNVIPYELRPAGESDRARIGYLWGVYAGAYLNADFSQVQQVSASLPEQVFAGVSLRQALDMIAAQASTSAFWYLDNNGRLHYGTSESNAAPKNVTSDTPGGGEIAPLDLEVDFDSKRLFTSVYVRGKTDAGSGWVTSQAALLASRGVVRTTFFDAPDCTTSTMRDALGNMYLGRVGSAVSRGTFTAVTSDADGWRAGQTVTVRSTHLGNINQSYRIARVRTSILGPARNRKYEVEFGGARAGQSNASTGPQVGTGIVGDLVDDQGNLLLGTGRDAATGGFGPALRRFIQTGIYNSDFSLLPPYPDATIVNAYNPLPFWSLVQAGGTAITAQSVADSSSGSGRLLRFQMDAGGSAGDDTYVEQMIPINSSRTQNWFNAPRVTILTGPTVSAAKVYATAQYVKADGVTTTGTLGSYEQTTTSIGANTLKDLSVAANAAIPVTPTDAYFLRFRFGFKRDAAATTVAEYVYATEAINTSGNVRTWAVDDVAPTTYGPARFYQGSGVAYMQANYAGSGGSNPSVQLDGSTATAKVNLLGELYLKVRALGGGSPPSTLNVQAAYIYCTSGATTYIADADCPNMGSCWITDYGNSGGALFHFYRLGTYNTIVGYAYTGSFEFRGTTFSAGAGTFSFFLESNLSGARIGILNNAGFDRDFKMIWL